MVRIGHTIFLSFLLFFSCGKNSDHALETPSIKKERVEQFPPESIEASLFDIFRDLGVPERPLELALSSYYQNSQIVRNKRFLAIVDFSKHSGKERFYLLDLQELNYVRLHVAHGRSSDPEHTGYAKYFGDIPDSNKTSLGSFLTGARYTGSNGLSMRLHGLSPTNRNAYQRAIVVHGAIYVDPDWDKMGRSLGCPSVADEFIEQVVARLEEGAILYHYHPSLEKNLI